MFTRKRASELTAMVIVLVLLTLVLAPQTPAHAQSAFDLQLSGAGALPWNLSNLKPGDSGTALVALRNASNVRGTLTIWLSNITDSEGANPESETGNTVNPGELSSYLLLQPSATGLSSSLAMPAPVASFPQSIGAAPAILVNQVAPGETVNLNWRWYLPPETGNIVQGDILSFTINYYLEELPAPPPTDNGDSGNTTPVSAPPNAPPPVGSFIEIVSSDQNVDVSIRDNGGTSETHVITLLDNQFTLNIDNGTHITTVGNLVPQRLEVSVCNTLPPAPSGMTIISPLYCMQAWSGEETQEAVFSQPARITLSYNPADLPQDVTGLVIAYYDEKLGWVQLQSVEDFIATEGQIAALINRSANIAILALRTPSPEITEPPSLPAPVPVIPQFAKLEVSHLTLSASEVNPGDVVTIRLQVNNSGQISGERLLILKINGFFIDSQLIRLKAEQNRNISFSTTPFMPGAYEVEIDGLTQSFTVTENAHFASPVKVVSLLGVAVPALPLIVGAGGIIAVLALIIFIIKK